MVAKLQALGVGVEFEDVLKAAGPEASSLGRPHLARALVSAGNVANAPTFDEKSESKRAQTVFTTLALIAGGVAVVGAGLIGLSFALE